MANFPWLNFFEDSGFIQPSMREGLCHGIACMAALALCSDEFEAYLKRQQYLIDQQKPLSQRIKAYREGSLSGKELSLTEWDIMAWMDGILLFHGILGEHSNFNTYNAQYQSMLSDQNYSILPLKKAILSSVQSDSLPTKHNRSPICLVKYFSESLIQALLLRIHRSKLPVAYLLGTTCHSIMLGGDQRQIYLINHNHQAILLSLVKSNAHKNFQFIYQSLYSDTTVQEGNAFSITSFSDHSAKVLLGLNASKVIDRIRLGLPHHVTSSPLLWIALRVGHVRSVSCNLRSIQNARMPKANKLELFAAKTKRGVPGLFMALQHGYADVIKAYMQWIIKFGLGDEDLFNLLGAQRADGTPGFFLTLQCGLIAAIEVYMTMVLKSALSAEHKMSLLGAQRADGTPGFFLTLQSGHIADIKIYMTMVLKSSLSAEHKMKLLAAKRADGTPGFFMALCNGHANTVRLFMGRLEEQAYLTCSQRFELVASKNATGTPGFFSALKNGHAPAVRVFMGMIIGYSHFTQDEKRALLAAKDCEGTPGLFSALQEGRADAVGAFVSMLNLQHPLTQAEKIELLAAKDNNGTPGLFKALEHGHREAVERYMLIVLESDLSNDQKQRLLAAEDQTGLSGLQIAQQNGYTDLVRIFTSVIRRQPHWTDQQKERLLGDRIKPSSSKSLIFRQPEPCGQVFAAPQCNC